MYDIPELWQSTPQAMWLKIAQEVWAQRLEEQLQMPFSYELLLRNLAAHFDLRESQAALDAVTGEPISAGMTQRVREQVRADFGESGESEVLQILDKTCGRTLPHMREESAEALEPMRLAVLQLSHGNRERLVELIQAANLESRELQVIAYRIELLDERCVPP